MASPQATAAIRAVLAVHSRPDVPAIRLFEDDDLVAAFRGAEYASADRDSARRTQGLLLQLAERGPWSPIQLVEVPTAYARLRELMERYPNFSALFDMVTEQVTLSQLRGGVLKLPPLLLEGPPGIGKSMVVSELAEALGLEYSFQAVGQMETGGQLVGSAATWSNTRVGAVFDVLTKAASANVVVQLDEIDKIGGDGRFPIEPALLTLLEPTTARVFEDQSIPGLRLDASHLLFIATANDARALSPAVRSRFEIIKVAAPSKDQALAVVRSVFETMRRQDSAIARFCLAPQAVRALAEHSPREMRREIERACARAITRGSTAVMAADVRPAASVGSLGFMGAVKAG